MIEDVWDDFRFEVHDLLDGGDQVVAEVSILGTGRGSGVETEMRIFNVWTLRDGNVTRLAGGYRERADALEAAGLSD